jgi:hypothetical protein
MSERRAPANTFAWMLVIVFIPWLGVPLYLMLGGRKLKRLARNKSALLPKIPAICVAEANDVCLPVANTVSAAGGFAPVGGNRITLLLTGEQDFAELESRILAARHSIHITTFILSRDETGRRIVELLAPARARGRQGAPAARRRRLPPLVPGIRRPDPAGGRRGRPVHARDAIHVARLRQPAQPPQDRDLRRHGRDDRRAQHRPRVHGADPLCEALAGLRRRHRGPGRARAERGVHRGLVLRAAPAAGRAAGRRPVRRGPRAGRLRGPGRRRAARTCRATPSTRASSR